MYNNGSKTSLDVVQNTKKKEAALSWSIQTLLFGINKSQYQISELGNVIVSNIYPSVCEVYSSCHVTREPESTAIPACTHTFSRFRLPNPNLTCMFLNSGRKLERSKESIWWLQRFQDWREGRVYHCVASPLLLPAFVIPMPM